MPLLVLAFADARVIGEGLYMYRLPEQLICRVSVDPHDLLLRTETASQA